MRLEFTLKEKHFFDLQYFISSKIVDFKKRKLLLTFLMFILFSGYMIYNYISEKDIFETLFFAIFFSVFLFFYYKYLGYSVKNTIKKFVSKNYALEIGKKVFLEIKDGFLITGNSLDEGDYQIKVKMDKIKNIFDEEKYLIFQLSNSLYVFLAKEEVSKEGYKKFKKLSIG